MLFGDRHSLAFEVSPLTPTWERRYLPEATAWAALSLWVRGVNLCEHIASDSDRLEPAVNVPLAPIADWMARCWTFIRFQERARLFAASERPHENLELWGDAAPPQGSTEDSWLEMREAWWYRHFVLAGTDDMFLPNVAFVRQGNVLLVQWAPRRRQLPEAPRWLNVSGVRSIPWLDAESACTQFVSYVGRWLREAGHAALYQWLAHDDPLHTSVDSRQALELFTGHTEDELAGLLGVTGLAGLRERLGLPEASEDPAASPLTQAIRDSPPSLSPAVRSPLEWLRERTSGPSVDSFTRLRDELRDVCRGAATVEAGGYLSAETLRQKMGLDGLPIDDVDQLLARIGVATSTVDIPPQAPRMLAGVGDLGAAAAILLRSEDTPTWVLRFEAARSLGHVLLDDLHAGCLGAASSAFCIGDRRRRSGAFAAELLLPLAALRDLTQGELDNAARAQVFQDLLKRFRIGARAAAYHLWNRGMLSSAEVRDDLIETYATAP